jgi:hypothetical protein
MSPFIVHHLGTSAYGMWVLVGSLTGYLGLLNLGGLLLLLLDAAANS